MLYGGGGSVNPSSHLGCSERSFSFSLPDEACSGRLHPLSLPVKYLMTSVKYLSTILPEVELGVSNLCVLILLRIDMKMKGEYLLFYINNENTRLNRPWSKIEAVIIRHP